MSVTYFQSTDMHKNYCEAGMILKSDPEHIHYLDEPCKISINEVKIIEKENVKYDIKARLYHVLK